MKRLADWWFAPAPAERLAALRIAIGGFALVYTVARLPELVAVAQLESSSFHGVGIASATGVLPPSAVLAIAIATCVLLAAFTLGVAHRYLAPVAALALIWTCSYRSSWGQLFHTENLMALHVLALAVSPAADSWALDGRRGSIDARRGARVSPTGYGWPIKLLAALTAATYVIAGLAKLRLSGATWLDGDQLRAQIAIDNLRKALLGDATAPLATVVLGHPLWLAVGSVAAIAVELGAPIALLGGRIERGWAVAAWGFHVTVVLTMNILFPYPLFGFAFLPLLPVERPFRWVAAWVAAHLRSSAPSP